ncbi:hypothetical protein HGRIS_009044 [Hohenbuehelia grisea]|uniref:GRIP domain-containing protein n=1 Tax=Hohenbuehelia grisea TaxID=104357 RepID=A0ABR3J021_9AGAR
MSSSTSNAQRSHTFLVFDPSHFERPEARDAHHFRDKFFLHDINGPSDDSNKSHYAEYRGHGVPPKSLGSTGDIFIDLTSGNQALYGRYQDEWREWEGPGRSSLYRHPVHPSRVLACSTKNMSYGWITEKSAKSSKTLGCPNPSAVVRRVLTGKGQRLSGTAILLRKPSNEGTSVGQPNAGQIISLWDASGVVTSSFQQPLHVDRTGDQASSQSFISIPQSYDFTHTPASTANASPDDEGQLGNREGRGEASGVIHPSTAGEIPQARFGEEVQTMNADAMDVDKPSAAPAKIAQPNSNLDTQIVGTQNEVTMKGLLIEIKRLQEMLYQSRETTECHRGEVQQLLAELSSQSSLAEPPAPTPPSAVAREHTSQEAITQDASATSHPHHEQRDVVLEYQKEVALLKAEAERTQHDRQRTDQEQRKQREELEAHLQVQKDLAILYNERSALFESKLRGQLDKEKVSQAEIRRLQDLICLLYGALKDHVPEVAFQVIQAIRAKEQNPKSSLTPIGNLLKNVSMREKPATNASTTNVDASPSSSHIIPAESNLVQLVQPPTLVEAASPALDADVEMDSAPASVTRIPDPEDQTGDLQLIDSRQATEEMNIDHSHTPPSYTIPLFLSLDDLPKDEKLTRNKLLLFYQFFPDGSMCLACRYIDFPKTGKPVMVFTSKASIHHLITHLERDHPAALRRIRCLPEKDALKAMLPMNRTLASPTEH